MEAGVRALTDHDEIRAVRTGLDVLDLWPHAATLLGVIELLDRVIGIGVEGRKAAHAVRGRVLSQVDDRDTSSVGRRTPDNVADLCASMGND